MKKFLTAILSAALSLCLLTGCSSASKSTETIRIGSLNGPTSIGLLKLMDKSAKGETKDSYSFTIATTADELLPKMISGELDIALVPANVSSVLYNKTEGNIKVLDINTLGVLYGVSGDNSISHISDLKGKTVYITNRGTTPDYVFQYLCSEAGLAEGDINIEYKSEAAEVAALLAENPDAVGILPQPFVTACCISNDSLSPVLDLTAEWNNIASEESSKLLTGVTVVRKDFLESNPEAVERFLAEHKESADFAVSNVEETAALVVSAGIIEKEPVAQKAIPGCNITYIDGEEMKKALSGYLEVLYNLDPSSVGGALPDEEFYY